MLTVWSDYGASLNTELLAPQPHYLPINDNISGNSV